MTSPLCQFLHSPAVYRCAVGSNRKKSKNCTCSRCVYPKILIYLPKKSTLPPWVTTDLSFITSHFVKLSFLLFNHHSYNNSATNIYCNTDSRNKGVYKSFFASSVWCIQSKAQNLRSGCTVRLFTTPAVKPGLHRLWLIRGSIVTIVSCVISPIVSLLPKCLQMNTDTERKDSTLTEHPEAADFYGWQLMVTHW